MDKNIELKFRMLCDENDDFIRDYVVLSSMNLLELHEFIASDLKYCDEVVVSFFKSDTFWERLQEFTLTDIEYGNFGPLPMEKVSLLEIIHDNNDRLIYQFDPFQDRVLYLELLSSSVADKETEYPYVALSQQQAPCQFCTDSNSEEVLSIFKEALDKP